MIISIKKNILEMPVNIIAHQVNVHKIGSGLAYQIIKKYPIVKEEHAKLINKQTSKQNLLGHIQYVKIGEKKYIANIFGQYDYGYDKTVVYTKYDALASAFIELNEYLVNTDYSLAFPYKLGCGLGNGNWETVKLMIYGAFAEIKNKVYICKL